MSVDLSQFYQIFFEEAQEHLDSMEALLLDIDIVEPDPEQLNAIFTMSPDGFVSFDQARRVTYVNPAFAQMTALGSVRLEGLDEQEFLEEVVECFVGADRDSGEAVTKRREDVVFDEAAHGTRPDEEGERFRRTIRRSAI